MLRLVADCMMPFLRMAGQWAFRAITSWIIFEASFNIHKFQWVIPLRYSIASPTICPVFATSELAYFIVVRRWFLDFVTPLWLRENLSRPRTASGVAEAICNWLCVGKKLLATAEVNVIHVHRKILNIVEVWEFLKVFHDGFLLSVSQNIEDVLLLGRSQYALKRLSTRISTKLVNWEHLWKLFRWCLRQIFKPSVHSWGRFLPLMRKARWTSCRTECKGNAAGYTSGAQAFPAQADRAVSSRDSRVCDA